MYHTNLHYIEDDEREQMHARASATEERSQSAHSLIHSGTCRLYY